MNIKKFQEIVDTTDMVDSVGEYVVRKFKGSGNFVVIDSIGDFIILDRETVDGICSVIWGDIAPTEKLN